MKVSFGKLSESEQRRVKKRLVLRKNIYLQLLASKLTEEAGKVLIVGDRPGPGAPTDPDYHHTPFYSIKHCSGWLNTYLELEGIAEEDLVWINAYDKDGHPTDFSLVERLSPKRIIALGGNAEKWLKKNGANAYIKVSHPQFHKRFKSSEPYELIEALKTI